LNLGKSSFALRGSDSICCILPLLQSVEFAHQVGPHEGNEQSLQIRCVAFADNLANLSYRRLDAGLPSWLDFSFKGAVMQKLNGGYGFLLGTHRSSRVLITP
jgi:hypothetical protein